MPPTRFITPPPLGHWKPSDRVEHLFRTGNLARAERRWRIEAMAHLLGTDMQAVIRNYGPFELEREPESIVYLIGTSVRPRKGEPVKIGYTNRIRQRLDALQSGSVQKLWLLSYLEGGRALERELHDRLFLWRIREDWFEMCEDVCVEFNARIFPDEHLAARSAA